MAVTEISRAGHLAHLDLQALVHTHRKHPPCGLYKMTNVRAPSQPSAWHSVWGQERAANMTIISWCYDDQRAPIFP